MSDALTRWRPDRTLAGDSQGQRHSALGQLRFVVLFYSIFLLTFILYSFITQSFIIFFGKLWDSLPDSIFLTYGTWFDLEGGFKTFVPDMANSFFQGTDSFHCLLPLAGFSLLRKIRKYVKITFNWTKDHIRIHIWISGSAIGLFLKEPIRCFDIIKAQL